jgi:hypothetical protein
MYKYINIFLSISLAFSIYLIYDLDSKKYKSIEKNILPSKTTENKSSQTEEQQDITENKSSQTACQRYKPALWEQALQSQTDRLTKENKSELEDQENNDLEYDHVESFESVKNQICESKTEKSFLQKIFLI